MFWRRCGGWCEWSQGDLIHLLSADDVRPPVEDDDTVVAVLDSGLAQPGLPVAGVVDLGGPLLVGQQVARTALEIVQRSLGNNMENIKDVQMTDLFVVDPDGVQCWLVGEVSEVAHAVVAGGGEMTDGSGTAGTHLTTRLDLEPLVEVDTPGAPGDDVRSLPPEGADVNVPVDSGVEDLAGVRLRDLLGLVQVGADEDGGEVEGLGAEVAVGPEMSRETEGMFSGSRVPATGEDDSRPP